MRRTRYAICGLSNRAIYEYALPLLGGREWTAPEEDYSGVGELVAIVDIDQTRVQRFLERTGANVPCYSPDDFDRMVAEQHPDQAIVAGPDFTHARYAVSALQHGLDVIVEKPLAHTASDARAILDAEQRSAGEVTVTQNARYEGTAGRLRDLIRSDAIGTVISVDLVEGVDTYHGASFFRRWNRRRSYSGGLAVTKGCHTIDLINWLLADTPQSVFAHGGLAFYGPESPHRPRDRAGALLGSSDEARLNPYAQRWQTGRVPEDQTLFTGEWQSLGYPAQYPEGEIRGIFDAEIDIEDHYSALIRYAGGATMAYTLCFSMPWEGHRIGITGTHGRIETESIAYRQLPESSEPTTIRVDRLFGPSEVVSVVSEPGGHDAADARIRRDLFLPSPTAPGTNAIRATAFQGAVAVATGEAMARSIAERREIVVAELLDLQELPEWES